MGGLRQLPEDKYVSFGVMICENCGMDHSGFAVGSCPESPEKFVCCHCKGTVGHWARPPMIERAGILRLQLLASLHDERMP